MLTPSETIYVDINNSNKPNKFGRDVFQFKRTNEGIKPYGYNYTDSEIKNGCSKTETGITCSAKIMKDGWKIKEDYPW